MLIGVVFGYLYLLFTTVTEVYETTYHFSQGATGLVYIGIGVGALIGISCFGALSDKIQNILIARNNGQAEPEFRLPPLIPGSFLLSTQITLGFLIVAHFTLSMLQWYYTTQPCVF